MRGGCSLTVDSTHLLGQHDGRGTVVCPPDPGNGEAVPQTLEVTGTLGHLELLLVDNVRVVVVAGADDGVGTELAHGLESLGVPPLLHEPTRRLGAEVDTDGKEEGGDEGRSELETPSDLADVLDDDVGGESEEDT